MLLVLVMGAAMVMTGCGGGSSEEEAAPEELTPIKISAINAATWAPVFIAKSEGFYEEEGLDVEFTSPGGPKGFQAMQAGDCEFSMLSQEPLLIAQEQGMESKVVAAMLTSRVYGLVATEDITDVAQLKGKTIFASDPGSAPYVFVQEVLADSGLDITSDVTCISASDNNAGLEAFVNGEVAAAFVNMYTTPSLGDMKYNVLADTTDPAQCAKYLGSEEFPGEMLCATKAYTEENPDTCKKVVSAVLKAQAWIAEHSDEEVAASLAGVWGDIDQTAVAQQISLVRDKYAQDCFVTESGEAAVMAMAVKAGIIKAEIPYDDVVDMSFVK